ncbi:MAG: HDIG domain-containing protein [Ignavibacteria bacterium]|nr:HDIG domain-containing protein [Ignavibacteria bacterium]
MNEFERAEQTVYEFVKNENLRRHMYAVSEAMRNYARKFGEDEDKWAAVGMLHDFDWEMHPNSEEHPVKGVEILKKRNWSDEILRAILSHADYTGVRRESLMEKTLFAVDELCGFIVACVLVQPDKKLSALKTESVLKKIKKKEFARNVKREDLLKGAEELGIDFQEHVEFVLESLKKISPKLGL